MSATSIEWATDVWNPFTGCDRVSPGCAHCYAAETAKGNQRKELGRARIARQQGKPLPLLRYQNDGDPKTSGPGFAFTVHQDRLDSPPRFKPGARVFVNSMSDVFHEDAPYGAITQLWQAMEAQPHANFLILTKRPERMKMVVTHIEADALRLDIAPLPNVWLGVSIENRRFVHRADLLRQTPAAVRFISAEPLLGPLIARYISSLDRAFGRAPCREHGCRGFVNYRIGADVFCRDHAVALQLDLTCIDWLITGAESGAKRRRFDLQWVRDLRDHCLNLYEADGLTRTAFFHKQGSAFKPGQHRELDGRTWDELPIQAEAIAA